MYTCYICGYCKYTLRKATCRTGQQRRVKEQAAIDAIRAREALGTSPWRRVVDVCVYIVCVFFDLLPLLHQ